MTKTDTIQITAFGETHDVKCYLPTEGDAMKITSVSWGVLVGRFPTGTKLHLTAASLWRRDRGVTADGTPLRPLRGETAAVVGGYEYVLDTTLYTHNRNAGRIVAWSDEFKNTDLIAKW